MKKGFSLAESLITLAIIGTLATIMVVTIANNKPDENKIMFKRMFYSIQDAVKILANDPTKYSGTDGFAGELFTKTGTSEEYFCSNMHEVMSTDGSCETGRKSNCNCEEDGKGDDELDNIAVNDASINFKLTNGVKIKGLNRKFTTLDEENKIKPYIDICIDVNGDREPNKGCKSTDSGIKKQDQFRVRIFANGKVSTAPGWDTETTLLQQGRSVPRD